MPVSQEKPLIDGFTYTSRILAPQYWQNSLEQLAPLRHAQGFRHRWYRVPDDQDLPITPYESTEIQIQLQPDSYIWAVNFWANLVSAAYVNLVTNCFRIVDSATEIPLQSQPVSCALTACQDWNLNGPGGTQTSVFTLGQNNGLSILPQPYLVAPPGLLNVEVTNTGGANSNCQLILFVLEPCASPIEWDTAIKRYQ